jgi:hypothetical protein
MTLIKQAVIYKFNKKKKFLIHSLSKVHMGASIASEPYVWLNDNVQKDILVQTLLNALDESKENLPNPENWSFILKDFLNGIGLKKQSDLYNHSISVNVIRKDDVVIFTPMSNNGSKGFVNIVPDKKSQVGVSASFEEMTLALEKALDNCE